MRVHRRRRYCPPLPLPATAAAAIAYHAASDAAATVMPLPLPVVRAWPETGRGHMRHRCVRRHYFLGTKMNCAA